MMVKYSIFTGQLPILTTFQTQTTKSEIFNCCCSFVIKKEYHFYLGEECNIISITCVQCTFGLGKVNFNELFLNFFSRYTTALYTLTHRVCSFRSQNTNMVLVGKYMPNSL